MNSKFFKLTVFLSKTFLVTLLLFCIVLQYNKVRAAGSALIFTSPSNGSYNVGQIFTIDVVIDGGGTAFNAAKAEVSVSKNLSIQEITLGDCGFAFVTTPTIKTPSFVGVILGDSSNKCTVYKLKLQATSTGTGYVILYNGSVKSYKKSLEILLSLKNGAYTINESSGAEQALNSNLSQAQQLEQPQNNLTAYNIILNIKNDSGASLPGAIVNIEHQGQTKAQGVLQTYTQSSNDKGIVEFFNVPKGVYKVKAQYQGKVLAETVLNVGGTSKSIMLGIQAKQTFNPAWLILIAAIVIFILIIIVILFKKHKNLFPKKLNVQENNL